MKRADPVPGRSRFRPAIPDDPVPMRFMPRPHRSVAGALAPAPALAAHGRRASALVLPFALALAAVLALAPPAFAQSDARALEVLEAAEARYSSFTSLCADFRQVLDVPLLEQQTTSRGRICQKQPDLFLMRFTEPDGDVVVADGEWLWIYYPSMDPGQVIRSPLSSAGGQFDFHREFLASPGEKYAASWQGRETVDGREADVVRLVPRQSSAYQNARVWIDRRTRMLLRIVIEQENGSVRRVWLSGQEVNPSLADSLFRFELPSGAQVITRPGM